MELKKGYKQTEVGVIPDDWDAIPLGEIFDFKNGLNKAKEFFGKGTPIVNYMDVFNHPGLHQKEFSGKVTLSNDEIRNYEVKKGDVFFTRTSETVEEIGMSSVMLDDVENTVFSGFVLRARPKNNRLGLFFKQYCFRSSIVRKQITSTSSYTTRALTNGRHLSKVFIPVPKSSSEQRAIAMALSDADELISCLEELIAKKRNIKQGAMQQLLTGKKRLPGFSGKWDLKKVEDFGEIITGSTPSTKVKEYWDGEIPWVTPTDITDKKNIYYSEREITPTGLNAIRKLSRNSVLVTCIASIGKNAILRRDGACNQQINAIVPNKKHDVDFLYYLFEGNKQYLLGHAGITATNIISKKEFSKIYFSVPFLPEQTAVAQVLSEMDTEIELLERKRDKYKLIKQGIMQELLTGKTRLI